MLFRQSYIVVLWFRFLSKNASSAIALYVVETRALALTSVVFSGVIIFGYLRCCLSYFSCIVGVASFCCFIDFTLRYALGVFVHVLLVSTLGAATCWTADFAGVSSTEFLLCSFGSLVCMGAALAFSHNISFSFGCGVGLG